MTAVHRLIEARADAAPNAIAVDAPGRRVSFAGLDGAANHVAHALIANGAGRDRPVVLLGDPSPEWCAGLLGILKSGSAYLPVDPRDRSERVSVMIDRADPAAIVTEVAYREQAAQYGRPVRVVGPEEFSAPCRRPGVPVADSDLAYVMFTSGSTGSPKGVQVEHRNLASYCAWVARANRVDGRVAPLPALSRPVFDASIQQLIAPLTRGDVVWLAPPGLAADPEGVLRLLGSRPGCGLHCVPALWAELLELMESPGSPRPRLASLFLGGDRVPEQLWQRTRQLLDDTACANVYGPTETTVQATGGFQSRGEPLSVGRPADGVTVAARRPDGSWAEPGESGELCIGGTGVARGYLGLPDLTAQRFLRRPDGPGRIYRSGDAGVVQADGIVHVAGRLDDQIKLRGFRIEPAEVEAVLAVHPDVASVTVVATEVLEAAVTTFGGRQVPPRLTEDLRELAARRLPGYMVPARIHVVDRMPATANGKVSRKGLAELLRGQVTGSGSPEDLPPRTPTELLVARVWNEVLGVEIPGRSADFFELGGHSLLANRVAARIRRATGVHAVLPILFEQRTVAAMAGALDAAGASVSTAATASEGSPGTAPAPVGRSPLSFQQDAIWSVEQALPGLPFNHVLIPVEITGAVDTVAMASALNDLVAAQPALRTGYLTTETDPVQVVESGVTVPLEVADLRNGQESCGLAEVVAKVRPSFLQPFDLATAPLLRAQLLRLAGERWLLALSAHHIACDGVSIQIMIDTLAEAYRRQLEDNAAALAVAPGYAAFALAQREGAAAGCLAEGMAYWHAKLDRRHTPLVTVAKGQFKHGRVTAELDAGSYAAFRRRAVTEGVTPFMVLTAAVGAWFARRAGVELVRLGTLAANRTWPEFDQTVGLFATTVVLDLAVRPGTSLGELAATARREVIETFEHQDVPLELVHQGAGSPFEVGVAWETPREERIVAGTRFALYAPDEQAGLLTMLPSSTPVTITAREAAGQLTVICEFNESALAQDEARSLACELCAQLRDWSGQLLAGTASTKEPGR